MGVIGNSASPKHGDPSVSKRPPLRPPSRAQRDAQGRLRPRRPHRAPRHAPRGARDPRRERPLVPHDAARGHARRRPCEPNVNAFRGVLDQITDGTAPPGSRKHRRLIEEAGWTRQSDWRAVCAPSGCDYDPAHFEATAVQRALDAAAAEAVGGDYSGASNYSVQFPFTPHALAWGALGTWAPRPRAASAACIAAPSSGSPSSSAACARTRRTAAGPASGPTGLLPGGTSCRVRRGVRPPLVLLR